MIVNHASVVCIIIYKCILASLSLSVEVPNLISH
jgi:hypothetical protein